MRIKSFFTLVILLSLINCISISFSINDKSKSFDDLDYSISEVEEHAKDLGVKAYIVKDSKKYYLNLEIYYDKNILVYGNYKDILSKGNNDFKAVKLGYYVKNNVSGEYRHHGYTLSGNLYNSNDFPRDSDSGRTVSEKKWIYRYWKDKTIAKERLSMVSDTATNDLPSKETRQVRKQIDNLLTDIIANSTNLEGAKKYTGEGYSVADHMNVYQVNNTRFNGEGKMMQRNGGRLWYQQFTTNKASNKELVEHSLSVEILNKGSYSFVDKNTVLVDVKLSGVFLDKEYVSEVDKFTYYNKEDIKEYHLKLNIGNKYSSEVSFGVNTLVNGNSSFSHIFQLRIDKSDLNEDIMKANGESYIKYYDGITTDVKKALDADSVSGGIKSLFTVDDIVLSKSLLLSDIKYIDNSIGEISDYVIEVKNIITNKVEVFNYSSDSSEFTNDLYEFLKSDKTEEKIYVVTQTVSNNLGDKDTSYDRFIISKEQLSIVELDISIEKDVIDVDKLQASDKTDSSNIKSKELKIDGLIVDWKTFFSGNYSFGEKDKDYLAIIEVKVISVDDIESIRKTAVYVHSSLPRVLLKSSGSNKVNRKITVENISSSINDSFVTDKYPITYKWKYFSVDGSLDDFKINEVDSLNRDCLFKKDGFYRVSITAKNSNGRSSEEYNLDIGILKDFEPNIIFNIWNNVLTRNEKLNVFYEVNSLDGDSISSNSFKIYYDENEDGICENLVYESDELDYSPDKLGMYNIINTVKEDFGEETLVEYISEKDKIVKTVERVFYVDNLRPIADVDLDLNENFQEVDLYILADENLDEESIRKLRESRIDYNNSLRLFGLDVSCDFRNLKTYVESQPVAVSKFTGKSKPPLTVDYNLKGFSGKLNRYNEINNPVTESYIKSEAYSDCITTTTVIGRRAIQECLDAYFDTNLQEEICYVDIVERKTSCTTEYRNITRYRSKNQYTGYYSGDVKKEYKQTFDNPFRQLSDKYVVYVASDSFNLDDYKLLKKIGSFRTIIIGPKELQSKIDDDFLFVLNDGSDLDSLIEKGVEKISSMYPYSSSYITEINENISIKDISYDTEGDKIVSHGYQYVQEEVFDNSMGLEDFSSSKYSDSIKDFVDLKINSFEKVGLFSIYNLVSDSTGNSKYDKRSNVANISVLVHRKPIADYDMKSEYRSDTKDFSISFTDKSYDLDHEFSDENKGIVDIKVMYRKSGQDWIYSMPKVLTAGTYEIKYFAKDLEGSWSDVKFSSFDLENKPSPEILDAKLKATDDSFSLLSIPATESITFYDIKTRYYEDEKLELSIYDSSYSRVSQIETVLPAGNGYLSVNDFIWNDKDYLLGSDLSDGKYFARIYAVDGSNRSYKDIKFQVFTPINLSGDIDGTLIVGEDKIINARTSKYVTDVKVTLYRGSANEITKSLSRVDDNNWQLKFKALDVPSGDYIASFTASTVTKQETLDISFKSSNLNIEEINLIGAWNYWRGQKNIFGEITSIEPHRFLSLEKIYLTLRTSGEPDEILIEMSEELENMIYKDKDNNVYSYKDLVGYSISFPIKMNSDNKSDWKMEYILPLADSTKSEENKILRSPYYIKVILKKGDSELIYLIDDINITGNTIDHVYMQQK